MGRTRSQAPAATEVADVNGRIGVQASVFLLVVGLAVAALSVSGTSALFTDSFANGSSTYTTDTLEPPTALTAVAGTPAPRIELSWTAAVDTYADGYSILRGTTTGGLYTQIAQVSGQATTVYTDTTVTAGTTYFYVVRSFYQSWESPNGNEASAAP